MKLAWVVLVAAAGCAPSTRQQAESAFARHDYRKAAELFDRVVATNPNDKGARDRRTDARKLALQQMLRGVQTARAKDPARATQKLGELLEQRTAWQMQIEAKDALAAEVTATAKDIEVEIAGITTKTGPLAAHHALDRHAKLLAHPDFGNRIDVVFGRVAEVGRATCKRFAGSVTADEPYWAWIVDRYCRHWTPEASPVTVPPFPELRRELIVDGFVEGQSDAENEQLRVAIADAFRASAWYAPTGAGTAKAALYGRLAAKFTSKTVRRSKDWIEQQQYTDTETHQESYQEPYEEQESYWEDVSSTEWRDGKLETVTKQEHKTKWVTKYRTAWRNVETSVTRTREIPHTFSYSALERSGHYTAKLSLGVQREPESLFGDVTAELARDDRQRGFDHDITFDPAGIVPERADLETRDQMVANERARLQQRFVAALDAKYAATYCSAARYDRLEAAAACAYLDLARAPAPVRARLRGVFGDDEPHLANVLARELL
jgi:hypothetical protein